MKINEAFKNFNQVISPGHCNVSDNSGNRVIWRTQFEYCK